MLQETEETYSLFLTFLSLVAFQLRGDPGPLGPPGYADVIEPTEIRGF